MNVIGVLVISMTVKPVSIIPAIILLAVAIPYRNFYVRTTRDLKRLDAICNFQSLPNVCLTT